MYFQARYQVMFNVGAITSGGGSISEYEYKNSILHLKFLSCAVGYRIWMREFCSRWIFAENDTAVCS